MSQDWTLHVGNRQFPFADATLSLNDKSATWTSPGFTWTVGQEVPLRLTVPADDSGPSGATGNSGGSEPAVTGVTVISSAGPDKTYGLGDTIHVRVTFDGPVDVTGTPRLEIDMDPAEWGEKWAAYQGGSGTATLTFAHTVVEPNISTPRASRCWRTRWNSTAGPCWPMALPPCLPTPASATTPTTRWIGRADGRVPRIPAGKRKKGGIHDRPGGGHHRCPPLFCSGPASCTHRHVEGRGFGLAASFPLGIPSELRKRAK